MISIQRKVNVAGISGADIANGPYCLVRHPGDVSNLVCLAGIGLALSSLVGLGLALFVVPLIVRRLEREEEMLAAEFGQEHERYRQRVQWRLIPYIFRKMWNG
jgi:protein-S-isoprenylcysteine O-methyltransferase Ste14